MADLTRNLPNPQLRRLGRVVAILAIALAAGHLAQTLSARKQVHAALTPDKAPVNVVQLSAEPQDASLVAPLIDDAQTLPMAAAAGCVASLTLTPAPGAMMTVALNAPCDVGARVVLHHAGLAVTGRVSPAGQLLATVPVMDANGAFDLRFSDGRALTAAIPMPDLSGLHRFAVQWEGAEGFTVHGMENGAELGQVGDVSPLQPGTTGAGGWLTLIGDASVPSPLLAQVYTYPRSGRTDVVVEAAVTAATCGKDLLGQTLVSSSGKTQSTDLTVSMPDCSAVGDFLVLKNLAQDVKLAAR